MVAPCWIHAIASKFLMALNASDFFPEVGHPHVWGLIINEDNTVLEPVVGFYQKRLQVQMDKLKQPHCTRLWFWKWSGFHLPWAQAWANGDELQGLHPREFLCAHWHFAEHLWGHMSQSLVAKCHSQQYEWSWHLLWPASQSDFDPINHVRPLYR